MQIAVFNGIKNVENSVNGELYLISSMTYRDFIHKANNNYISIKTSRLVSIGIFLEKQVRKFKW